MPSTYLIIAHGSREPESNRAFLKMIHKLERTSRIAIIGAFLELAEPSVPEGIERCLAAGADDIFVVPLMLFPGRHVKRDIPHLIREAKRRHRNATFHYGGPLSDDPMLFAFLKEKIGKSVTPHIPGDSARVLVGSGFASPTKRSKR